MKAQTQGTPKTLIEALERGLREVPQLTTQRAVAVHLSVWVRDYVSQKVTAACLGARSEGEADRMIELFERIVGESNG